MPTTPMTPRQRVRAALAHQQPDRVPFAWNFGPTPEMRATLCDFMTARGHAWDTLQAAVDDIRQISPTYSGPELPPDTDIWGIGRRTHSYGTGSYDEILHYPLAGIETPTLVDDYAWPDPSVYDYANFRDQILAADPDGYRARKLAIDSCGNPFEIYCWMTGLEEALINVLLNPDVVHTALTHITHFFAAKMQRALQQVGDLVDICYFADDLGGQQTLLMSRRAYRSILQPYHAQLFRQAKQLAPHAAVMFHSDGAVFDILPDLIYAGLDVLEAVQTDTAGMEPTRLKATYGDTLSFHGGISVQKLLPHADAHTVTAECQRLVQVFGAHGGYIAAPSHAVQVGTPPKNILAMLRAVLGDADYEEALSNSQTIEIGSRKQEAGDKRHENAK